MDEIDCAGPLLDPKNLEWGGFTGSPRSGPESLTRMRASAKAFLLAALAMTRMAFSDVIAPFSFEERASVDRFLVKQVPSVQDEDILNMAQALVALNSSALPSSRTKLCQLATKEKNFVGSLCPGGLSAAAVLGCELNTETRSQLPKVVEGHLQILKENNLKTIACASSILLSLKAKYGQATPDSLDINALAKRIMIMQRPDGTFGEDDATVPLDSSFAIQALANLALLDKDRFQSKLVRPVLDKRDAILTHLAESMVEDPSVLPLSLALQVIQICGDSKIARKRPGQTPLSSGNILSPGLTPSISP